METFFIHESKRGWDAAMWVELDRDAGQLVARDYSAEFDQATDEERMSSYCPLNALRRWIERGMPREGMREDYQSVRPVMGEEAAPEEANRLDISAWLS